MAERKIDKKINEEEEHENRRLISWQSAKEKALALGHKTDELVRENPWKSVAVSAAVGAGVAILAAAIIGRRREESFWDRFRNLF